MVKPVRPVKKVERKLSDNQEESRKSKSTTELTKSIPVQTTASEPSLVEDMAPKTKAPVAQISWAQRMRNQKSSEAQKATPVPRQASKDQGLPQTAPEKPEEQVKVDPIAKKINDIIYADDKPEVDGKISFSFSTVGTR